MPTWLATRFANSDKILDSGFEEIGVSGVCISTITEVELRFGVCILPAATLGQTKC